MKFYKTLIWGLVALAFLGGVYYFTVMKPEFLEKLNDQETQIVRLKKEQINYLEIQNKNIKYILQKNDQGWNIEEPVSDIADDQKVESVLEQLTHEKQLAVVKEGADIRWQEYGLDSPLALIVVKNNLGQMQKIFLSEMKNFEGNHYARIDNQQKILVVNSVWYGFTTEKLVYYREKTLYRGQTSAIKKIAVKSLRDRFTLQKNEKGWTAVGFEQYILDQNRVRSMIKAIAENTIQDYISEGDPSDMERKEKGLNKEYVEVVFETDSKRWSVAVNLHEKDRALYALTEKPTYLVKLDLSQWELFGNLNLDALRDRRTMTFDFKKVGKVFIKRGEKSLQLTKEQSKWKSESSSVEYNDDTLADLINQIHDLEIGYFLKENEGKSFSGQNMVILKTLDDQLVFQLNWGPQPAKKDYYLARTQNSDSIFGIKVTDIDQLSLDKILETKNDNN